MKSMTYSRAVRYLSETPDSHVVLKTRDATLNHRVHLVCWLEDGEIVHTHPTDPKRGAVSAPTKARYWPAETPESKVEDKP